MRNKELNRTSLLRGLAALTGIVAMLSLASCGKKADAPDPKAARTEVTFSILSAEKAQDIRVAWDPILADMEKQTGLKVHAFYAPNYTALIEAMRFGKVQAGWFSNFAGLEASRRADGEVFAHSSYYDGSKYTSIIIVKADSKLTAADLLKCNKTLNFGMGDVQSTSGTLAPLVYFFLPEKKDPNTCFKTVRSASHQANIEAVSAGVLDAATNNSTALLELADRAPEKLKKIKVIWTSPGLPDDVIMFRKDLDPATKEKLRSFFLSYGTGDGPEAERQRKVLRGWQWGVFKADDNSHFVPIRLMEATGNLMKARHEGDPATIKLAETAYDLALKEQKELDAKTPLQAPADPK
jgi:phosphonate transport system substrate-binding protein